MPFVELTSEPKSSPFDVSMDVFNESINVTTCESVHMFDATGGGVNVSAGMAVNASGVEVSGAGVPVEIKVDVAGAGSVGV